MLEATAWLRYSEGFLSYVCCEAFWCYSLVRVQTHMFVAQGLSCILKILNTQIKSISPPVGSTHGKHEAHETPHQKV